MSVGDESALPGGGSASELATRRLGAEIRRVRAERGLTLVDISGTTGLSVSMLSMLERGKTGVSVGSLVAIASAMGVAVGELFQTSTAPSLSLVRYEEQQELTIGHGVVRRVIQRSREHGLEVASLHLAPGAHTGSEMVRHEGQEVVVVQSGTLTVHINETVTDLESGDSIRLDAAYPHRFANNGAEVSKALLVVRIPIPHQYGH
jgi:transcriptional regulator with XRE-family HTH domain